jgi:hypothetical protein
MGGINGNLLRRVIAPVDGNDPWSSRADCLADDQSWRELAVVDCLGAANQIVALVLKRPGCAHRLIAP